MCYRYTIDWILFSRIKSFAELIQYPNLSPTSSAVLQLCRTLENRYRLPLPIGEPSTSYIVNMDNGFATIPLFDTLREKGISACGTTCVNGPKYLLALKSNDELFEWNTMDGCAISSTALCPGVLCFRWMDNNIVRMLSTIHPWNETTFSSRRKPRTTSSNATMVQRAFGEQERMSCYIPTVIDDYNHHMNRVDLADQCRATYTTHQRVR